MGRRPMHAAMVLLTAALIVSPLCAQSQQRSGQNTQTPPVTPEPAPIPLPPPPQYEPPPVAPASHAPSPVRNLDLGTDYSKGPRWFPGVTAPYRPIGVGEPAMTNTPRMEQLIQGGKMMLSLEDALTIALENNLDVAVERYVPLLDEANLLLAKSGINGRIGFDPILTAAGFDEYAVSPINNPLFSGILSTSTTTTPTRIATPVALKNHIAQYNFQYTQNFSTGSQLQVTFDNSRESTNFGEFNLFNPYLQSSVTFEATQSLLAGFGKTVNNRYILEAKNTIKVGESQFAQQAITTVTQVSTDYWELVFARENVKVGEIAVAADQRLYDNNKIELQVGMMAPLDVITAESQLASDQQVLVQDQTTQLEDEMTLLVAITRDPMAGPLLGVEIVPTTPIFTPDNVEDLPLPDAVREAWKNRPELEQASLNVKNQEIEMKATKNLLLPTLNVYGEFQTAGLGGNQTITTTTPVTRFAGGYGNDLNGIINANFPTLEAGLNLTLPIRNRAAQAQNVTAQLTHSQQETQYRQTQNTIVLNVRQTMIAMEQDRAAVKAAEEARVLAQQSYDDEVRKLQFGSSTAFTVVQKQQLLTAAQGTELRDRINLIEAEVLFNEAMGRTLTVHNITVGGVAGNVP